MVKYCDQKSTVTSNLKNGGFKMFERILLNKAKIRLATIKPVVHRPYFD
jgi:hypothetical protein